MAATSKDARLTGHSSEDVVPLDLYSRALDEIWHLRRALAYEAATSEAHGTYKTFPKSRRPQLEEQVARMRRAAAGHAIAAYGDRPYWSLDAACREAGIPLTLTRHSWEAERS